MALGRAAVLGTIASFAIPYVMETATGQLGELLQRGLFRFTVGGIQLLWSWPIFVAVTLFAWAMLTWSNH